MKPAVLFFIAATMAGALAHATAIAAEAAETTSSPRHVEVSVPPAPPPTPPPPSPQILQKDTEEAITAMEERRRAEGAVREAVRARERQPNLQRDVIQGIQSLGIRDALQRR